MKTVRGRTTLAVASVLLAGAAVVAAVGLDVVPFPTDAVPTHAAQARNTGTTHGTTEPGKDADRPEGAAQASGTVTPETLLSADGKGPRYGTGKPGDPDHNPPIPSRTDQYGDPDAVVIRAPAKDYGSGFHGDYGMYKRETSPEKQQRAAARSIDGCLVIGDSIATFVVKDLVADLRRNLGSTCVHDTWPGRATEGTANALLDLKRRYGLPRRIVVMSGTNDIFNPPLFEAQMNRIIEAIGPDRQILWVSTFDSRRPSTAQSKADERNTAWINSVLEARASKTPNMQIVPWDSLFRDNSGNVEAMLPDGVHPNKAGIQEMIGLVRRSLS